MAMVAEAYRDGLGTRADPIAAENWFRRAVDAGSVTAKLEYGRMLVERKDDPQSLQRGVALLEQAASAETPYAWTALGDLHLDGAFPGADPAKGVAYLERAHKRSEERRVGKEWVSTCSSRGSPYN